MARWLAFLGQLVVKNPAAKQETWVRYLGQEDPLEKEKATHSSILAWKIPWTEEPGGLQSMGVTKESDMTEQLHFLGSFAFLMYFSVFSIFLKMNMFCF